MNMSADKTFELKTPKQSGKQTNLITRQPVESGSIMKVGPRTTVVIFQEGWFLAFEPAGIKATPASIRGIPSRRGLAR